MKTPTSSEQFPADEELIEKCLLVIRQENKASTSLLQRRFRIGYARAALVMEILEQRGHIGPFDPTNILKPRTINDPA